MAETKEIPRLTYATESLTNFLGTNLRKDPLSIRDEDVVRAINADMHTQVGSMLLRKGRVLLVEGYPGAVRRIQHLNGARYVISGGMLSKGTTVVVGGLHGSLRTSLLAMRPLNDTLTWTFIADQAGMKKENNGTVRTWGIAAPTGTPTLAAGAGTSLSGVYTASYTYVRKVGTAIAHESNPSPTSNAYTAAETEIAMTGIVDSSDPQVTHKRIYRTVNGGSTRLFDQEILQGVTTATLSVSDTGLGTAVETDNDPPPTAFWATRHQEHVFFLDPAHPSYLWWSKRYRPESVPTTNYIDVGTVDDPFNALTPMAGLMGAFTRKRKYRIFGNATSGFVHQEALSSRGTVAPQACLVTEKGCLFPARDGLFLTDFTREDQELSQLIAPVFEGVTVNDYAPINFGAASTMAMVYWKQRLYFAYPSGDNTSPDMMAVYSFHTNQWYFWTMLTSALYAEESTGMLLAGTEGGDLLQLESGTSDNGLPITLTFEPATRFFQSMTRKRFDYVRVNAEVSSGTLFCVFYIDDIAVTRIAITGSRDRQLFRLGQRIGTNWRAVFTYTGTGVVSIDGVEVQAVALRGN